MVSQLIFIDLFAVKNEVADENQEEEEEAILSGGEKMKEYELENLSRCHHRNNYSVTTNDKNTKPFLPAAPPTPAAASPTTG